MTDDTQTPKPRARRGFALMDPERQRAISKMGGASVAPENRAFSRNRDLAVEAGRKGGLARLPASRPTTTDPVPAVIHL